MAQHLAKTIPESSDLPSVGMNLPTSETYKNHPTFFTASDKSQGSIPIQAFDKKVIYVYRHLDVKSHEGWLKVGETKASRITGEGKNLRILEQNTAANVAYEVLYTTDAVTNDGRPFSDFDIHRLLVERGIQRESTINPNTKKKSEWFQTDLRTVVDLIEEHKMSARKDDNEVIINFSLREEQKSAIQQTINYYEKCQQNSNLQPIFLWNAKPRFGKTLTAYSLAAKLRANKILVVTNRPAIADSWYSDFKKFDFKDMGQSDNKVRWIFTSSTAVKKRLGDSSDIFTREQQLKDPNLTAKSFIHFISLQDIKGRDVSGFKQKNSWIFDLGQKPRSNSDYDLTQDSALSFESNSDFAGWDLVIIDESHEGADTKKALRVFEQVKSRFTLHLSGTPFKAIASNKFSSQQIFNWSYTDEQTQKQNWPIEHGLNPYADLPRMEIFTYQLSRILEITTKEAQSEGSEYAFDLTEFLKVGKIAGREQFLYEDRVRDFIKNLSNPRYQYPFSTPAYRENLRHTFWLLPGIKACEQFKKLLLEDEYFGANYQPEDIILAAGSGDEDRLTKTALSEVRCRIGSVGSNLHPLETRTITLSCGQLTTGVTVPAWTAVFMLNNCKSPSLYMQSAFRAQNPFSVHTSGGEYFTKEACYVFDFAPDRILQTLAEIADSGVSDTPSASREHKVKILINFLPVIAEDDEGRMKYLDAHEVLTIPNRLIAEEVVNRGFMSNHLFKNISGIFGCPEEIRSIISKLDEAKADYGVERNSEHKTNLSIAPHIWLDKERKLHINEDIVIATTNGLLGNKKYVEINTDDGRAVESIMNEAVAAAYHANYSAESIAAVKDALSRHLPKLVASIPEVDPTPDDPNYHDKLPVDNLPPRQKSAEEKVRDRLRGFVRTIPSFLMAYGASDTTLSNFGDNIPDSVFEELTSITKSDFYKLRDGMDYETIGEDGKSKIVHFDGLFNEDKFNDAIQEFNRRRIQLADYYQKDVTDDIFSFILPQQTNQIFTPRSVVKSMIDCLEAHHPGIFASTTHTFLDPYMKSGMFITEVVKRIFEQTRARYHNDTECVRHILEHQVYGLAPTSILTAITTNYIFGFDPGRVISREHFREYDTAPDAKRRILPEKVKDLFNLKGDHMKFTAVVGNPPYQETVSKSTSQTQSNSNWIYQYFQRSADQLGDYTCLIYPFGGWFDSPERLGGFGRLILGDGHTVSIDAYEGTADRRAWYRNDKDPEPIFGRGADLSAGVAIVLRDLSKARADFRYSNRMYSDDSTTVSISDVEKLVPNPAFLNINRKLSGSKLYSRIKKGIFGIESNFVEQNPDLVSFERSDWQNPVLLLTNDKSGSTGRARRYWTDESTIPKGHEYLDTYKVVMASAYPKKTFVSGKPTINNVQSRAAELIEILPKGSAFGRSRLALFMSNSKLECENFVKYTKTQFFAALLLQEPNRSASFGDVILDQDFSANSDIDWSKSIDRIDNLLCEKYNLTSAEIEFLGIKL